jgi:TetR/AcrR family transcriptional regulator, regulator of autoinduction and epiphytic fitness
MRDVKSQVGSLRAERAALTERRIAESARGLFASRGYAATTLVAIALETGVAVQTVYAVFGSKANILRALLRALVNEPAADTAYLDALAASTAEEALVRFAHSIRLRWDAAHDIVLILGDAASADPAIRAEMSGAIGARQRGIAELARALATRAPELADEARSAAMIDALTLPEVYGSLVGRHNWTPERYEAWIATALLDSVIGQAGRRPR